MRKVSVFLIALIGCCTLYAQDKVIKSVLELGKNDNRTMVHEDYLANVIGGRPIGSHNLEDAEAWVAKQFKSWGLEVIVQEVGEIGVGFSRGPWSGRLVGGKEMNLHFVTPSYTAGTKGPQKGHVLIEPHNQHEFDRIKGRLKGAWILIEGDSKGFPLDWTEKGDSTRRAMAERKETVPALFCHEMEEAGVLGFIQAADIPLQAHYDRPRCFSFTIDKLPKVCEIKLERAQYDEIRKMVKEQRDFQLEFNIRNHFFEGPVKFHNILGVIKGSRYPDEYVLLGGHLDSYDVASGAVDDGNGVAVTMEAARLLATSGAKPKRSIMFCIWTGEEYGLLGSKFFVQNSTVPLDKISNYFNRDGGGLACTGITVPEAMYEDFAKVSKPLENYTEGIPFTVEKRKGEPGPRPTAPGGSDHSYFAMSGVPAISLTEKDIKGYNFNYRNIWHTENDNFDQLFRDYMEHSSVVTAVVVYGLSNLNHLLSREGLYSEQSINKNE